ncbi:MAG: carboxylating nicotinate-nucleotide diphosphorylase [Acidobacteria bacterium]|nr:carboxylating nicotinate-nucleotide diphosphorylase [Acidobacteriota bacterium]
MTFEADHPQVVEAVRRALEEDIGSGDVTSDACIPADRMAEGRFVARQKMTVAGVELLPLIYSMRGGVDELRLDARSGDPAVMGQTVAYVRGKARMLLECERTSLNFLQRLSGVATLAHRYVDELEGTRTRLLDTRKTTPGLRRLEKMAAAAGGAVNHRMGLFDAILIKNNHIVAAGGVRQAIEAARRTGLPVEVEVRTREELVEALANGADHMLLDNLTPLQAAEWMEHIGGRATVELSGGITLDTIGEYAETGPDYISVGAITHSAPAVNLNFRIKLL